GSVTEDDGPLQVIAAKGVSGYAFTVNTQVVSSGAVSVTPKKDSETGKVENIDIDAGKGTAVVPDASDPEDLGVGKVRFFKAAAAGEDGEDTEPGFKEIDEIEAASDGSFKHNMAGRIGDGVYIAVEKGEVPLEQEFVFYLSEPIEEIDESSSTVTLTEQDGDEPLKIDTELSSDKTGLYIRPENRLKENTRYILELDSLPDLSGKDENKLSLKYDLRTKKSGLIGSEIGMQNVYDTLLYGSYLFTAAGTDGLKIMDVSKPTGISTAAETRLAGHVRGLALWKDYPQEGGEVDRLVVVGGGVSCPGYLKVVDFVCVPGTGAAAAKLSTSIVANQEISGMAWSSSGY
ncbi:MAG: Ig-like domain-containing protein, partial [Candidatus Aminicenantes bacterium]|nr:Ig-like domain-containing protein [Candidatus Aminicenantes bacterium]